MSCIYGIEQSCSECRMCQSKEEEEQPSTETDSETNKKAILVIDMPKSCEECPMLNGADECILQDEDTNFYVDTWDNLMAGCPLKKLPEEQVYPNVHSRSYVNGYNACIDEIVKESEG